MNCVLTLTPGTGARFAHPSINAACAAFRQIVAEMPGTTGQLYMLGGTLPDYSLRVDQYGEIIFSVL